MKNSFITIAEIQYIKGGFFSVAKGNRTFFITLKKKKWRLDIVKSGNTQQNDNFHSKLKANHT
jgi:hypothetical protein